MKQPKRKAFEPMSAIPSHANAISVEYARIRRLIADNKMADAWSTANALHEKHPKDPSANYAVALILAQDRQKAAALRFAEAAIKYAPDNALYHVFLGKLYVDLEMLEFAPALLNRAFELDETLFQAPWIMAEYYFGSGQGDKALHYYQKALGVVPKESLNSVKMGYANCFSAMGRVDEAETIYSELFDDSTLRIRALTRFALLRKNNQQSKIASQIRVELAAMDLDKMDRSALLLCLGRLFENGRKFDEAFYSFRESRKLLVSVHNILQFRAEVDDKINTITPDVISKFHGFGDSSTKPVFVVGMPRSGTTLTEQIIAAHSQVEGVGEINRMSHLAKKFADGKGMSGILAKMTEAGPWNWKDVPQQYLNLLNALAPDARRTVDKMPHNFLHLGFIHLCFPNAKIIHCKRNPLDNFISAFQNAMNSTHGYSYDQVTYGEYYIHYLRLMDHWKEAFPGSIHESNYEVLTANPEIEVRKMLDFLGLPWEDACLKFNERESTVKTLFSRQQVRNPINTGSIARWRNYEKHLAPIIAVLDQAGIQI